MRSIAFLLLLCATSCALGGCRASLVVVPRLGFDARRGADAAFFEELMQAATEAGHPPVDVDAARGRFVTATRRAGGMRFVVQCSRDGFVTVTPQEPAAREVNRGLEVSRAVRSEWLRLVDALERSGATGLRGHSRIDAWPANHGAAPVQEVRRQNGEDGGLIAMALVVFDVGWMLGLIGAAVDEALRTCTEPGISFSYAAHTCGSWPLAFVPIAGGALSTTLAFDPGASRTTFGTVTAFGAESSGLQIVGLVMLAAALANQTHGLEPRPPRSDHAHVAFRPSAPGADAGASLVVRF